MANWVKAILGLSGLNVLEQKGGQCGKSQRAKGDKLRALLGGEGANH